MRVIIGATVAVLAAAVAAPLAAQDSPIQLSLFTPVQIVPETKGVSAVRLNLIYSVNTSVRYVDLGLVNLTSGGASAGVQWALVAINKGSFSGWQSAVGAVTGERFEGLQEKHPDEENWKCLKRAFHTLKGDSKAMGFDGLSTFAHKVEDLIEAVKNGEPKKASFDLLFGCADAFGTFIDNIAEGDEPDISDIVSKIEL